MISFSREGKGYFEHCQPCNFSRYFLLVADSRIYCSLRSKAPPPVLPPLHENFFFIGDRLRIIGLILCSFVALLSVLCASWVIYNRKHRVVLASQPIFLLMVCLGTIILASTIIPLSIDDQHSSKSACDAACVSAPWLFSIGFTMIFSALFSKLWRVNKVGKLKNMLSLLF